MEYRKNEIRAGIFLLTTFVIFTVLVFTVSDIKSFFRAQREIRVLFSATEGIEANAQVRFSGIRIGTVKGVRVAPEHDDKVELTLSVFTDAMVKEDAHASIKTLGLVGKKYVDLSGGSASAKPLPTGGILYGEDALKMEDLTKAGLEVVAKVRHIAQSLDRLLADPALSRNIKGTLQNMNDVSANVKELTATLNMTLDKNKDNVTETVRNLPEIMKKIDANLANLKAIMEKAEATVGKADATLAENRKQIDEMVKNVNEVTKNVKEFTEEVKKEPWKLLRKP